MALIWIFVALVCYKFFDNLIKYLKCIRLMNRYIEYLMNGEGVSELLQAKKTVEKLILGANIENYCVPWTQPAGYGLVYTMKPSVLGQFPSRLESFARPMTMMLEEAIGVYKSQMWEALSPLYWVETLIWLPKRFLSYLGVSDNNFSAKIINSIFQGLYWLAGFAFITYNDEFKTFLLTVIKRMESALLR